MKINELYEKIGIARDELARRRTNVSSEVANITADQIESGVTIEALDSIGVPVFRYSGQVTIHGALPAFNESARPGGYKAVFQNGNGTIGVRYVAVDGEKKKLICRASRYGTKTGWHTSLNSQGLELVHVSHTKEDCLAAFRAFPRDLICGTVSAFRGIYGEFYCVANVGAIPVESLWPLIKFVTGIESQSALDALIAAEEQRRAEASAKFEAERAEADRAAIIARDAMRSKVIAAGHKPVSHWQHSPGEFVVVTSGRFGPVKAVKYCFAKRGASLCYSANKTIWKRADKARFEEYASTGFMFTGSPA